MNPLFLLRDCCGRAFSRKKTLICFALLFLLSVILGIIFIKTPAVYDYHFNICDRFVSRVCFSSRSTFQIFWERFLGSALILLLLVLTGLHYVGLVFAPVVICFRGYILGGSLCIFFSVYRMTGALIVFALYLPIHILLDVVFLCAVSLAFCRAPNFCFDLDHFKELLCDFLTLLVLVAVICLLECFLLLVLFHPIGNIL